MSTCVVLVGVAGIVLSYAFRVVFARWVYRREAYRRTLANLQ
jgi:hypothetical protein